MLLAAQIHKNLKNDASVCLIKYEEKTKIVLLFNEGRKMLKMRMYAMWHVPHISVPMCDHSTKCNSHWHIQHRKSTINWMLQVTPDLVQHAKYFHRSMMCKVALKHTQS